MNLPRHVFMGYLPNATRRDAVAYSRGLIERFYTALDLSWLYLEKAPDGKGWLYEVHEGGDGKSLLAYTLKSLESQPATFIQLAERTMKTELRNGRLQSVLLPENTKVDSVRPEPGIPMLPFRRQVSRKEVVTLGVVAASAMVLLGMALHEIYRVSTPMYQESVLPAEQWGNLVREVSARGVPLEAHTYDGTVWRTRFQEDSGSGR